MPKRGLNLASTNLIANKQSQQQANSPHMPKTKFEFGYLVIKRALQPSSNPVLAWKIQKNKFLKVNLQTVKRGLECPFFRGMEDSTLFRSPRLEHQHMGTPHLTNSRTVDSNTRLNFLRLLTISLRAHQDYHHQAVQVMRSPRATS